MEASMNVGDLVAMRNLQLSGAMGAVGTQMGDGLDGIFAALFAQLMGDASGLQAENADELIAGILDEAGKKDTDDPNLLAMQMLADALFTTQALDLPQQQNTQVLMDALDSLNGSSGLIDHAQLLQMALAQGSAVEAATDLAEGMFDDVPDAAQTAADPEWKAMLETLTAAWGTPKADVEAAKPTEADALMEQMRAQSALRTVRNTMTEKPRATQEQAAAPLDIEALQQAVNNRQFAVDPSAQEKQTADIQDIAEQLKTGILNNVKQGKSEFVVRLKPEGMGEITVKFTENKNEIALRIVTSSASVGKMIANEVTALQNALRPLRAQVQEIVTVPAANQSYAAGTALAGDQAGAQFAWHNNDGQQSGASSHARRNKSGDFDAAMEAADEVEAAPDDANVNLLI